MFSQRHAAIYHYRIALQPSIRCAGAELTHRDGLLLHLQLTPDPIADVVNGFGEAAPLIGFSLENRAQSQQDLIMLADCWLQGEAATRQSDVSASARFAFSCALHELQLQQVL